MNLPLTEPSDLRNNLLYILKETNEHHQDRSVLLRKYVLERLNKSYESFKKEVDESFNMLTHSDSFKSRKRILNKL